MTEHFELKPITEQAIPAAVERAEHYRLLNQPQQAESICLDVLALDPDNQRALATLILALTDQFATEGSGPVVRRAREYVKQLTDDYQRSYYAGIVEEREVRAYLKRGPTRKYAYDGFRQAMDWFEEAARIRPLGNDDAVLRWNSCVRTIRRLNLKPPAPEPELGLE